MYDYISGTVEELLANLAVIDCGGVGYACHTSSGTLAALQKGKQEKLYTYLNVGDGILDLYGFLTRSELHLFRMLLSVSGVGPKAALSILSIGTPDALALAVAGGNEQYLTAAPGVGKKIAKRIILELRDKMSRDAGGPADGTPARGIVPGLASKAAEAAQAMGTLGYSDSEIAQALEGIDMEALTLEEILRQGLKKMAK